jgi:FkbM family methyltransferase
MITSLELRPGLVAPCPPQRQVVSFGPLPATARRLLSQRKGPAGRLLGRAEKQFYALVHRRLGLPITCPGRMVVAGQAEQFTADLTNTGYLDYVRWSGRGGYENATSSLFDLLAPEVGVFFDIGANWGYYTALFCTNAAFAGRVHAFELAPRTWRDLSRMVAGCHLAGRVTCHGFGLSDIEAELAIEESYHSYLTKIVPGGASKATGRAQVRRLDSLGLPPPDLIKLDVEGHEAAVLAGAQDVLAGARPMALLESWYDHADPAQTAAPLRLLDEIGYQLYLLRLADGAQPALHLVPVSLAQRMALKDDHNVLACPPGHRLLGAFRPAA